MFFPNVPSSPKTAWLLYCMCMIACYLLCRLSESAPASESPPAPNTFTIPQPQTAVRSLSKLVIAVKNWPSGTSPRVRSAACPSTTAVVVATRTTSRPWSPARTTARAKLVSFKCRLLRRLLSMCSCFPLPKPRPTDTLSIPQPN